MKLPDLTEALRTGLASNARCNLATGRRWKVAQRLAGCCSRRNRVEILASTSRDGPQDNKPSQVNRSIGCVSDVALPSFGVVEFPEYNRVERVSCYFDHRREKRGLKKKVWCAAKKGEAVSVILEEGEREVPLSRTVRLGSAPCGTELFSYFSSETGHTH
ncbi:hypothetical protein GQ53DRAFT_160362 [Thozetella sp. PMI_491]|nr:hypothetical protein GQ53DRAFT_160362 [Thozetella sp. PMI_491]